MHFDQEKHLQQGFLTIGKHRAEDYTSDEAISVFHGRACALFRAKLSESKLHPTSVKTTTKCVTFASMEQEIFNQGGLTRTSNNAALRSYGTCIGMRQTGILYLGIDLQSLSRIIKHAWCKIFISIQHRLMQSIRKCHACQ